jgi:hypothetical protein
MLIGEMIEKGLSLADGVRVSVHCASDRPNVTFFVHAGKSCSCFSCSMSDTLETMQSRYEIAEAEALEARDACM